MFSLIAFPAAAVAMAATYQAPAGTGLDVTFDGVRSARGILRICLNRNPAHYPDCGADPQARKLNVPANRGSVRFDGLPQGSYAITAMHDENGDGSLNTFLGVPREGFAFSNNPTVTFGPPSYSRVRFTLGSARGAMRLRFKYFL